LLRWPASYFGYALAESGVGKHSGFFVTPKSVTEMMALVLGAGNYQSLDQGDDEEHVKARKEALCERMDEPCAGAGDMILTMSNKLWLGGPFFDVNHTIKNAGRAQLALYAPWFTQSYCQGNSLGPLDELAQTTYEQRREYAIERQRAIYAADDWIRRHAGNVFSDNLAVESVVKDTAERRMRAQHIIHRAEARRTRDMRETVKEIMRILEKPAEMMELPVVESEDQDAQIKSEDMEHLQSDLLPLQQELIFSTYENE